MNHLKTMLAAASLFFVAACGGGGGGDDTGGVINDPPPAPPEPEVREFVGRYSHIGAFGFDGLVGVQSMYGTSVPDGASALNLNLVTNSDGDALGIADGQLPYTIEADGDLVIRALGVPAFEGGISSNGTAAVLGAVNGFAECGIEFLLRRPIGLDPEVVQGAYHMISYIRNAPINQHIGISRLVEFQAGNAIRLLGGGVSNNNGIVAQNIQIDRIYSVQPDGAISITFGPSNSTAGGVNPTGDFAILGGTVPSGVPRMDALIRASTAATTGTLSGEYYVVSFETEVTNHISRTGTVVFDGAGGGLATMKRKAGSGLVQTDIDQLNYQVDANGAVVAFYQSRATTLNGAVSPDGRFAILGGAATGRPTFEILIRKSEAGN